MEQLPKIVRQRLQATAKPGVHPDPDLLTAFAEKSLADRERINLLDHLARCADCREVVSLAVPEFEPPKAAVRPARSGWLRWPVLRWGALAACVIVVGAAVTLRYQRTAPIASNHEFAALAEKHVAEAPPAETTNGKLVAKFEPKKLSQPERDIAASSKAAKQLAESAPVRGRVVADELSLSQPATPPSASVNSRGAAAPQLRLLDKSGDEKERKDDRKEQQPAQDKLALDLKASNEIVTLEESKAASTTEIVEVAPDKAKAAPRKLPDSKAGAAVGGTAALADKRVAESTRAEYGALFRANLAPRWTLTAEGTLLRSLDAGKTWETIPVANVTFRAVAAVGASIWVGGPSGALYHSSDAGQHWLQVKPATDGAMLTDDLIGIKFDDAQQGQLTTASGEIWTTADGGQTWQKN